MTRGNKFAAAMLLHMQGINERATAINERATAINERATAINERATAINERSNEVHRQAVALERLVGAPLHTCHGLLWYVDNGRERRAICDTCRREWGFAE